MRQAQSVDIGKRGPADRPLLGIVEREPGEIVAAAHSDQGQLIVRLFQLSDEAGDDLRRIAGQEGVRRLARGGRLFVGRPAAVEEVIGAGGRAADREHLRKALEGLLALLDSDNESRHGVRHTARVYGYRRYVLEPELAQGQLEHRR